MDNLRFSFNSHELKIRHGHNFETIESDPFGYLMYSPGLFSLILSKERLIKKLIIIRYNRRQRLFSEI